MSDSGAGSAWRRFVSSPGNGYTIELRAKISYRSTNYDYAMALSTSDGSNCDMCLTFTESNISWNGASITNMNTAGAYHTYRIAKIPDENRFVLWCDGTLVRSNLGDALPSNDGLNRLLFGAIGGKYGGRAEISYLRFTKGAYAPVAAERSSVEFEHKYDMAGSDARFLPDGDGQDWTCTANGGTASLSGGVLSVDQPQGATRYYRTVGAMGQSVAASTPFTFEMKARIGSAWQNTDGRVLNVLCGTPRTSFNLFVGTGSVQWYTGNDYVRIHTGDNTDGMHVFRVAYEGEGTKFAVWRDGEKIGEGLASFRNGADFNYVRFGVASSSSHGGAFEVDYVRWTTDGAYAPGEPRPGLVIFVR